MSQPYDNESWLEAELEYQEEIKDLKARIKELERSLAIRGD